MPFHATEPGAPARPAPVALAERTRRHALHPERPHVVESRHVGHVVVVGPDGSLRLGLGDVERLTFPRSCVKPFQVTACLEALRDNGRDLPPPDEIAVAWSSHRGEPAHLATVARLLARSGRTTTQLTCPPARPEAVPETVARRLHHNCSGKHALFALAGDAVGCPPSRLLDPTARLQTRILGVLADTLGAALAVGVDGCGAPAVAVPLVGLARGFRELALGGRWAAARDAGFAHPLLVGGQGRLESVLLAERIAAKPGADGVFGVGWLTPEGPWGLALKVEDGDGDASAAATHALLSAAGVVSPNRWELPTVRGGGRPVGVVRGVAALVDAAAQLRA